MKSIRELFLDIRQRDRDSVILRFVDNDGLHNISVRRFARDVEDCSVELYKHFDGDPQGRHIAFPVPASYEFVVSLFACELIGGVAVLINPFEEKQKIKELMEYADVDMVIDDPGRYISSDKTEEPDETVFESICAGDPEGFSFLLFSSGTEGSMKGVMLSQRSVLASAKDVTDVFGTIASIRSDIVFESCYTMLPLYHVFGLSIMFTAISGGVIFDLCTDFRYFYRDLKLLNSEIIACPPMAIKMFVADLIRGDRKKCFMDKFASVGKPGARTQIEIRDREVFVRNDSVMLGYYKDPVATANVLKDGWIATGDYGHLDDEGFLFITGRKKNLIILSGGENVSPEELEDRLYENKAIKECIVYAKNDRIAADIYAPELSEEEVMALAGELNKKLPNYKRLSVINYSAVELEKTGSGKIKRAE